MLICPKTQTTNQTKLSTESDVNLRRAKSWTAINRLSIIWKSDPSDEIKEDFFQSVAVSILHDGWTTWTLRRRLEKQLDDNYTRILRAFWNRSWKQHPIKQLLYGHLSPILQTIQVRRTRHVEHCWRNKDELISVILLWTSTHGHTNVGRSARVYIDQVCANTGYYQKSWLIRKNGMCVCVCERERERESERERECVCVCVCVCQRERERERERDQGNHGCPLELIMKVIIYIYIYIYVWMKQIIFIIIFLNSFGIIFILSEWLSSCEVSDSLFILIFLLWK